MKKRRAFIIFLLVLLILSISTGFLAREYRREQASQKLIVAIKENDTEKALAALKVGADPNACDYSNDSSYSFIERIMQLLNKIPYPRHRTALLLCFAPDDTGREENPQLVNALLEAGADPDLTGESGVSALMWASSFGNEPESLRLLLKHGGNPYQKDKAGQTALHWAAVGGNAERISLLLSAGADINAQDNSGLTPLYAACTFDRSSTIEALLQHHANPNIRNCSGLTPLDEVFPKTNLPLYERLRKAGAKTGAELDAEKRH